MDIENEVEGAETLTEAEAEATPLTDAEKPDPEYLTKSQFEQAMQTLQRQVQSQLDKRDGRLERKYAELRQRNTAAVEAAKATGMPPEQLAALQKQLEQSTLHEVMAAPTMPQQAAPMEQIPSQAQPPMMSAEAVNAMGARLAAQYGLEESDPEAAVIVTGGTPEEYLATIVQAGVAKKARVSGAPARSPAIAATGKTVERNPIARTDNVSELYRLGAAEMTRKRQGG